MTKCRLCRQYTTLTLPCVSQLRALRTPFLPKVCRPFAQAKQRHATPPCQAFPAHAPPWWCTPLHYQRTWNMLRKRSSSERRRDVSAAAARQRASISPASVSRLAHCASLATVWLRSCTQLSCSVATCAARRIYQHQSASAAPPADWLLGPTSCEAGACQGDAHSRDTRSISCSTCKHQPSEDTHVALTNLLHLMLVSSKPCKAPCAWTPTKARSAETSTHYAQGICSSVRSWSSPCAAPCSACHKAL